MEGTENLDMNFIRMNFVQIGHYTGLIFIKFDNYFSTYHNAWHPDYVSIRFTIGDQD